MREDSIMIKEAFEKGLREDKKSRRNTQELETCRNLRPTKYGLSAHDPITVAPLALGRNIVSGGGFDDAPSWADVNCWNIADGKATHTPGMPLPLWQDTGIDNDVDRIYRFTFTVKTCTVGSVTPAIQSSTGTARTANGTYTELITHQGTIDPDLIIFFFPSLDFDGSIDKIILEETTWPFPQLFKGRIVTLLADRRVIFTVNEDTWALTELTLYDALDPTNEKSISADGPWQFTDFGDVWFLFNKTCTIAKVPSFLGKTVVFDHVKINSGLNFRNKMILGGFSSPLGEDLVTNGRFTGHANSWTLATDWTYGSNKVTHASASLDTLDQEDPNITLAPGTTYRVKYTVSGRTVGSVKCTLGDTAGSLREADGTFTEDIVCGATQDLKFWPADSFDGSVDNVEVREVGKSYFEGTRWADIWKTWLEYGGGGAFTYENMKIGPNWIMWSAAGGGDIYWPFVAELSMLGIPNTEQQDTLHPHFTDFLRTNDIGFLPMPWQGEVRCIKQLGNNVIVYGDGGISALVPREDGRGFEITEISRVGILSKELVGGDEKNHLFIDKTGIIWYLSADLRLAQKGYEYLFDGLLNEYIAISHDPQENVFYLCSENKGYVLSGSGVGELVNYPASLIFAKPPEEDVEALIGSYSQYFANTAFEVVLDTFDMELRGIKTIHGLSVGTTDVNDLQAAVQFRYDGSQAFSSSAWIRATQEGISTPIISAVDFRIKLKGTINSKDTKIEWLDIRWKLSDKRAIRGQHSGAS